MLKLDLGSVGRGLQHVSEALKNLRLLFSYGGNPSHSWAENDDVPALNHQLSHRSSATDRGLCDKLSGKMKEVYHAMKGWKMPGEKFMPINLGCRPGELG
jgi:hypothetical protein